MKTLGNSPLSQAQSTTEVNRQIAVVRKGFAAGQQAIQDTVISIMRHSMTFSDCSAASRLLNVLPKTFRRALIAKYFTDYSPIVMTMKKGSYSGHIAKNGSTACKNYNIEGALANPFWDMKEAQTEPKLYLADDFLDNLSSKIEQAARLLKAGKVAKPDVDKITFQIAQARAFVSTLKSNPFKSDVSDDDLKPAKAVKAAPDKAVKIVKLLKAA